MWRTAAETAAQELRYAARGLLRERGFFAARDADPRGRDRRLHRDVQHRPCGPAAAARGAPSRTRGDAVVGRRQGSDHRRADIFDTAHARRGDAVVRGHRPGGIGELVGHPASSRCRTRDAGAQCRFGHLLRRARRRATARTDADGTRRRTVRAAGHRSQPRGLDAGTSVATPPSSDARSRCDRPRRRNWWRSSA